MKRNQLSLLATLLATFILLLFPLVDVRPSTALRPTLTPPPTNTPQPYSFLSYDRTSQQVAPTIPGLTTRTAFERDVRRHVDTFVPRVVIIGADSWISPKEGQIVVSRQRVRGRWIVRLVK